ncbi:hypothetical protein ACJIZ3_020112 [Penstemon smallii]|uniref:Uncharacterized protein n=1 Tax=Penstemon smallii TaxID=265156 RepID=A0ABD3SII7_9LAMI
MEELKVNNKRVRDNSEEPDSEVDSPEVKRLRENLLNSFDDDTEFCTTSRDLDSFMKIFEEEITPSTEVVDLTLKSGPDLGYLLEASDDELGLPPTNELDRVQSDSAELGCELWEIPSYVSFGFGYGETDNHEGWNGELVSVDGLFDYSDLGFGSGDLAWRLPAQ